MIIRLDILVNYFFYDRPLHVIEPSSAGACRGSFVLASYVPSSTLLDLGHIELKEAVQPCEEFLTI